MYIKVTALVMNITWSISPFYPRQFDRHFAEDFVNGQIFAVVRTSRVTQNHGLQSFYDR